MAGPIENQGQLQDFVNVLRRRVWQVAIPALLIVTFGSAFAVVVPKKYVVKTQLELRETLLDNIYRGGATSAPSTRDVGNASYQIRALQRIKTVVEKLEWPDYLALDRRGKHEFLQQIQENVAVTISKGGGEGASRFVTIKYADPSPTRAEEFLRQLRSSWIENVVERDRITLRAKMEKEDENRKRQEKLFQQESSRLTKLRSDYGISQTQPGPGSNRERDEDPVFERLSRNETELDDTRRELSESRAELEVLQDRLSEEPLEVEESRSVAGLTFEKQLRDIDLQILDLLQSIEHLRPSASRHQRVTREIEKLQERKLQLQSQQRSGEIETDTIPNPERDRLEQQIFGLQRKIAGLEDREANLASAIARDEERFKELEVAYQEERTLAASVESYEDAFKKATEQYYETVRQYNVISSQQSNPFAITEEVVPPKKPSEPNPYLIVVFSIFAGLGLGTALAVLSEYSKNCFRSVHDISRVMVVPVLGTVNTIVTHAQLRQRAVRRFVVGFSSFVVIGAVVFVTWAWVYNPDLLTQEVRDAIDAFRSRFR